MYPKVTDRCPPRKTGMWLSTPRSSSKVDDVQYISLGLRRVL